MVLNQLRTVISVLNISTVLQELEIHIITPAQLVTSVLWVRVLLFLVLQVTTALVKVLLLSKLSVLKVITALWVLLFLKSVTLVKSVKKVLLLNSLLL